MGLHICLPKIHQCIRTKIFLLSSKRILPLSSFIIAGDFNAYTSTDSDFIQYDKSFDLLDDLGDVEYVKPPLRANQDDHELNGYGKNLLSLCKNTSYRIANGRFGTDFGIGKCKCITEG